VSRVRTLRHVLWTLVVAGGCGRLGFDSPELDPDTEAVAEVAASLEVTTECGAFSLTEGSLAIRNVGADELVIEDAEATGGFSITTVLPISIAPGEQAALAIAAPAAVIGTDRGGDLKSGELTLYTNEAIVARTVALSARVVGANIEFRSSGNQPLDLTFSASSGLCPPARELQVHNSGTEPVMVSASSSVGLASTFSSGMIDPNTASSGFLRATTSGPCVGTGTLTYMITGTSCTATPVVLMSSLTITGAGNCSCS